MTGREGYTPQDLTAVYNCAVDLFEDPHDVQLGERVLHGIPFRFGTPERAVLHVPVGGSARIPVGSRSHWLILAHATAGTELFDGSGRFGDQVATYTLEYEDGKSHSVDILQRVEIGPTPRTWDGRPLPLDWGQTPLLAVNDAQHVLMDRVCGRYDEAGARFVDIEDAQSRMPYVLPYRFYLWGLRNPWPEMPVRSLRLQARQALLVGAVTSSALDEEPFTKAVARPVLLDLRGRDIDERVRVEVERGTATYVYRTVPSVTESGDLPIGWGRPRPDVWTGGYCRISASPSAQVRVFADEAVIGSFTWRDLLDQGTLQTPLFTVKLPSGDQSWVRIRVRDGRGELLPCRIRLQSPDGIPVAPYAHHAHINSDGNTWNLDIGGDVRLGADTWAFIDGKAEGWLPAGDIDIEVARGFEYRPLRQRVHVTSETDVIDLTLERVFDARSRGYVSGDTHVHFVSTHGAELEARAEDVGVTNLLLSQWGHLFTGTEEFTGHPHHSHDGRTIVFAGQENRTNMLGHINLLGVREPILPWCTGGSEEAEIGGGLQTTLSHWADECHAQGGTVVLAHFPVPYGETAALLATGRLDAVETIAYDEYNVSEYYRYLNAGFRIPLVAGTDKMTSEVPIGLMRTYARVGHGQPDYWDWCEGIRKGDTLSTSGPLLWVGINGHSPGSLVSHAGASVFVDVQLETLFPVDSVEVVCDGEVVHVEPVPEGAERHSFQVAVPLADSSWIAVRCFGRGKGHLRHADTWQRPVFAHTSPIYVCRGAEYSKSDPDVIRTMRAMVVAARRYVVERARTDWGGQVRHRHGESDHLAYLTRPFDEALEALRQRQTKENTTA